MRKKWILFIPLAIVGVALFIAIGGQVVMQLWNWLLPTLFGTRQITFWQALGLLALCRILFGGFGGGGGAHRSRSRWKMGERCKEMTQEERERVSQGLHGRWGREAAPDSKPSA